MRAHFATDVPASPDTDDGGLQQESCDALKTQPNNTISSSVGGGGGGGEDDSSQDKLKSRIMEFKSDSSKMAAVGEFIDEVLEKAEEEANKQQGNVENTNSQQNKNKTNQKQSFAIPDFKNGKVVNKARGFVVRLFESICNCANNAAAAPVTRFKFRSGKRASTSTEATEMNGKSETNKKEEKSKKSVSVKEKKNDKIKFEDDKNNVEQEIIELQ